MSTQHVWSSLDLSSFLPSGLPELTAALQVASDAYAAASALAAAAAAGVAVVVPPIVAADAAATAAIAALDAFITTFVATQLSTTSFVPLGHGMVLSGPVAFRRLADSFFDEADPQRPLNTGVPMHFALSVFFASGGELKSLQEAMEGLLELLGRPLTAVFPVGKSFLQDAGGYPPVVVMGQGMLPDWQSVALADLGLFGEVVRGLLAVRSMLTPTKNAIALLAAEVAAIARRTQQISTQLQRISDVLQRMAQLQLQIVGLDALHIFGQATLVEQTEALLIASVADDSRITAADLTVGFVALHTQSNLPIGPALVRSLFGQ